MRKLVNSMVTAAMPLSQGLEAVKLAQKNGSMIFHVVLDGEAHAIYH